MLGNVFTLIDGVASSPRRDVPAVIYEGREQSYGQLHDRALRIATALDSIGVCKGDRVGVWLPNCHEWVELFFGLAALGAVCVPVNVLYSGQDAVDLLEDCGAETLVVGVEGAERIAGLATPERVIAVQCTVEGALDYETLVAAATPSRPPAPSPDDLFVLYYSSGTTGRPKAAAHTHQGVLWNAFQQINDFRLGGDDRYLVVPSVTWAAGFHNLCVGLWWLGRTVVLMPTGGMSVERIAETVLKQRCTHTMMVPTLLKQLMNAHEPLAVLRDSTLRWVLSGAEPVPLSVIEAVNAELPTTRVVQGYGMSEFPTIAAVLRPEEAIERAGSTGQAMSATWLKIRDSRGEIVSSGEGEVLLRSMATMREYYAKPEQTAEALRDGWLHSGDMGRLDEDGYLTITGRTKDMIISGGINIFPKEIEEVIYRVPGVGEAAVIGLPDERWGETVAAVIVPDGTSELSQEAVRRACEALGKYKRPRTILIRSDPLPRSGTQKVLKRELRPWAEQHLAQASRADDAAGT